MNSVIPSTRIPRLRATRLWESSWASTERKNSTTVMMATAHCWATGQPSDEASKRLTSSQVSSRKTMTHVTLISTGMPKDPAQAKGLSHTLSRFLPLPAAAGIPAPLLLANYVGVEPSG